MKIIMLENVRCYIKKYNSDHHKNQKKKRNKKRVKRGTTYYIYETLLGQLKAVIFKLCR